MTRTEKDPNLRCRRSNTDAVLDTSHGAHPAGAQNCQRFESRDRHTPSKLGGTDIARLALRGHAMMSLVRLLGFTTLSCGCVTGRYREVATNREITYVEEKGLACDSTGHRRNHTLTSTRFNLNSLSARAS